MKKQKIIYIICIIFSWLLSNFMCIDVTYRWVNHLNHSLNSAPAWVNIIYAIPYLVIIALLQIIGSICYSKYKKSEK